MIRNSHWWDSNGRDVSIILVYILLTHWLSNVAIIDLPDDSIGRQCSRVDDTTHSDPFHRLSEVRSLAVDSIGIDFSPGMLPPHSNSKLFPWKFMLPFSGWMMSFTPINNGQFTHSDAATSSNLSDGINDEIASKPETPHRDAINDIAVGNSMDPYKAMFECTLPLSSPIMPEWPISWRGFDHDSATSAAECNVAKSVSAIRMHSIITVWPLWFEQEALPFDFNDTMLTRKVDPLLTDVAIECSSNSFPAACATKVDGAASWEGAGIINWLTDHDLSDEDNCYLKPLLNLSDANANEVFPSNTANHFVPPCVDAAGDQLPVLDAGTNINPLFCESQGASSTGFASNSQNSNSFNDRFDQPYSVNRLGGTVVNYGGCRKVGFDREDRATADVDLSRSHQSSVNLAARSSNDLTDEAIAGNLMTMLTDIQQSVDDLEVDESVNERHLQSETNYYTTRARTRASSSNHYASDDESGVRSLSNDGDRQEHYDYEFNAFGGYVEPYPELAEVGNLSNDDNYILSAPTSASVNRLHSHYLYSQSIRHASAELEQTEENVCEFEDEFYERDSPNVGDNASLYTVPKVRADVHTSTHVNARTLHSLASSDVEVTSTSSLMEEEAEESYAPSISDTHSFATSNARSHSHTLSNANLPYGDDEIVHSSFSRFETMLTDTRLSTSDVQIMKDIRRRGKNKIAAMNCRRRKQRRVDMLIDERGELSRQNRQLEARLVRLREQARVYDARLERALQLRQSTDNAARPVVVRA